MADNIMDWYNALKANFEKTGVQPIPTLTEFQARVIELGGNQAAYQWYIRQLEAALYGTGGGGEGGGVTPTPPGPTPPGITGGGVTGGGGIPGGGGEAEALEQWMRFALPQASGRQTLAGTLPYERAAKLYDYFRLPWQTGQYIEQATPSGTPGDIPINAWQDFLQGMGGNLGQELQAQMGAIPGYMRQMGAPGVGTAEALLEPSVTQAFQLALMGTKLPLGLKQDVLGRSGPRQHFQQQFTTRPEDQQSLTWLDWLAKLFGYL